MPYRPPLLRYSSTGGFEVASVSGRGAKRLDHPLGEYKNNINLNSADRTI
jgi:hypothetical protein